ncbi:MAG: hypothetical protein Q6K80_09500 [Thermostichus sp. DG_1_6_bins_120]
MTRSCQPKMEVHPQRWLWSCVGGIAMAAFTAAAAWARPVLEVRMTLGLPISPNYWYVVALSRAGSPGPTANLVDPNVSLGPNDYAFVRNWDYLIRVTPLNEESVLQSTIQRFGEPEREFAVGFNEVRVARLSRDRDTLNFRIDLSELEGLDGRDQDIQVALLTARAPFRVASEETNLAIDATRGDLPNYYRLSLTNQRQVIVDDPQRQETLRRSRELIQTGSGATTTRELIEGGALEILAANILTFDLRLVDQ